MDWHLRVEQAKFPLYQVHQAHTIEGAIRAYALYVLEHVQKDTAETQEFIANLEELINV